MVGCNDFVADGDGVATGRDARRRGAAFGWSVQLIATTTGNSHLHHSFVPSISSNCL
jgi:hypothetical protein